MHHTGMQIRTAFQQDSDPDEKQYAIDYFLYLWCGPDSPLFDKSKMATFERYFIADKETHKEEKGYYFKLRDDEKVIDHIMDAFGLKGDRETAIRFMDSLDMINIVTHVADARTCVLHPASHTHRQLSDEQLREAGVAPDLIRLSVGIEDVEDILDDIRQALDKI